MTVEQIRALCSDWPEGAAEWAALERDRRVGVRQLAARARRRWARRRAEEERREKLLRFERRFWGQGVERVAGVDEAGRGCLAGPVVAAAVVLAPDCQLAGLDDSKKLSPQRREALYEQIQAQAVAVGVGQVEAGEIDRRNILQATLEAMRLALAALQPAPQQVLVDGRVCPRSPFAETALVDGDARSLSVAAASVVAKVHRDRLMVERDAAYPQYGFAAHKGYGSPEHLAALRAHGPCPLHRRSFGPVAALVAAPRSAAFARFSESIGASATAAELERVAQLVRAGRAELSADELADLRQLYRQRRAALSEVGVQGEERAAEFLARRGYQVLERRYRMRGGEVDLVARRGDEWIFVEVKTRASSSGYVPEERVDARKRQRLLLAARHYLHHRGLDGPCRFDVIAVTLSDGRVEHWADAFRP